MSSGVGIEVSNSRPSFAKVAASAYTPKIITTTEGDAAGKMFQQVPHIVPGADSSDESVNKPASLDSEPDTYLPKTGAGTSLNLQTFVDGDLVFDVKSSAKACEGLRPKGVGQDDCNAGSTSSGTSAKRSAGDDKSTESGTASAFDEKESLRPDDSASFKASDDEDAFNASQSMSMKARQALDLKDYPHQVSQITATNGVCHSNERREVWQPVTLPEVASEENVGVTCGSNEVSHSVPIENFGSTQVSTNPDDMLLEALQTPRDRVFILKLEQDIVRFIQNSREPSIELPQSNSFHRLLTHRLADYYLLGHTVDNGLGAVRLHRTPYVRLPQSLGVMAKSIGLSEVEQQSFPTKMIMRRDSQPKTKSLSLPTPGLIHNPEGVLKSQPDTGGDGSSESSQPSARHSAAKLVMSREEREAKYIEARQRIFGASEEVTINGHSTEDKGASRSNSANGKRKARKSKEYQNDEFDGRSQSTTVYPPSFSAFNFPNDLYYTHHYPHSTQSSGYNCLNSDLPSVLSPYKHQPPLETEYFKSTPWPVQQFSPSPSSTSKNYVYSPNGTEFDLSAEFQHSLQIFHSSAAANSTPVKSPAKRPSVPFGQFDMQQEAAHLPWPALIAPAPVCIPFQTMCQSQMTTSGQVVGSSNSATHTQQYPYGKLPNPAITNGKFKKDQHPIPGSYNRPQQFNPNSQSFIPISQQQASSKEALHDSSSSTVKLANSHSVHSQFTPVPCSSSPKRRPESTSALNTNVQGLANPLPQPISVLGTSQSTIAKWGIPAHLPPKPPPPALFPQAKGVDQHLPKDALNCSNGLKDVGGASTSENMKFNEQREADLHKKCRN